MAMEKNNETRESPQGDLMPIERPDIMANIIDDGDVDSTLAIMERKAALAPRFKAAQDTILASQTYAQDWTPFGDNMCLSSAGAERIGRLFDIKFFEVESRKEDFSDGLGKGYRYIYEGKAAMGGRVTHSMGIFSSRDKLLGSKGGEPKALEDINENHIRTAAYHIMIGNAIKSLLGLRGLPKAEWERIMSRAGGDISKGKAPVKYASGSKGGTSADDKTKQAELFELCAELANDNKVIVFNEKDKDCLVYEASEDDLALTPAELANANSVAASSFISTKDNKLVTGKKPTDLKGKWLNSTLGRVKGLVADQQG